MKGEHQSFGILCCPFPPRPIHIYDHLLSRRSYHRADQTWCVTFSSLLLRKRNPETPSQNTSRVPKSPEALIVLAAVLLEIGNPIQQVVDLVLWPTGFLAVSSAEIVNAPGDSRQGW